MMKKKVLIIGAGGLIGQELINGLIKYQVNSFKGRNVLLYDDNRLLDIFSNYDVIINLAGRSIFTHWNKKRKREIYESRINTTEKIVKIINLNRNPIRLINASAIGIYKEGKQYTENNIEYNNNFLANTVKDWEAKAENIIDPHKLSIIRLGVVISKNGGAYQQVRRMARFKIGFVFGRKNIPFSFIHIQDVVGAIEYIIEKEMNGIFNFVSENVNTYEDLIKISGKFYRGLKIIRISEKLLKIIAGEVAVLFTEGQSVYPERLIKEGYRFRFNKLDDCISNIENS